MSENNQSMMQLLHRQCASGPISYRDYIATVLYAKGCGYYQRATARVGRSADHDFYTSESLGRVFSQLVVGASESLLGTDITIKSSFIEIAAEPGRSLLDQLGAHPFASSKVIRLGEPVEATGQAIIFANEWLDALPFHRLVFRNGQWRERGVLFESGKLAEVLLENPSAVVAKVIRKLSTDIEEGYQLDLPLEAENALKELITQDWTGLILLFDYGKTTEALLQDCPNGTARSYYRHEQGNDLLERPGEQDITCDINWTPLVNRLKSTGFTSITLESQESFLVKRAASAAEAIVTASAGSFSTDRQTLMELIHPANMGQRFQVLWGMR
ncbi:MAG: SAM-dependent methyltransferase [Opitutales bacterium]